MDFETIASQTAESTRIQISARDIERILGAVSKTPNPWEIVDLSDVPVPAVFEVLKIINRQGLVEFKGRGCVLTEKGDRISKSTHPVLDLSCRTCSGRGITYDKFAGLAEKFRRIQKDRPAASHDYDQGYVTPDTSVSRFIIAYERGDIAGRDILVLGDDDLVSIVLCLSRLPRSVTIVEIDKRLTSFIRDVARSEKFEIKVDDFDLRKPLPERHVGAYDTFFTDPPETIKAADAFVGRGIAALRQVGSAGYFGFTRREASLRKWFDLQRLLIDRGVVMTDIIHNFSEYENWGYEKDTRAWQLSPVKVVPESNWYRSALYRIETLEGFRGNTIDYGTENIYEDNESSTT